MGGKKGNHKNIFPSTKADLSRGSSSFRNISYSYLFFFYYFDLVLTGSFWSVYSSASCNFHIRPSIFQNSHFLFQFSCELRREFLESNETDEQRKTRNKIVDKKNQLDVTFCILYFSSNSCSTCFVQRCAHHQELTTAWCYSLVLVCAVAAGRWLRLLYSLFLF